ncbi:DHA2 family efflux MFS transporter permease subunit [Actinomadura hibisca]|uniref:DHA2 family efflux MFS transporter permease subunit n=1 Tax=Actinomadura hibisca TaxID=68565 RepID=UPI0009FD9A41|nr:DHA2 family efflux MFS transporter permease subunit [Actinomadura hibisca]
MSSRAAGRPALALAVTCVPAFMVTLDLMVVTVALSTIRTSLDASLDALGWTVNAYTLAFGVLIPTAALLGDRLGRRRVFGIGLGVFTLASAACALAPTAGALIAARAVQGAGAALITPLSLALVTAAVPPGRRGAAVGVWGAATGSAVALGPLVGGLVVAGTSWPWIFWVNVPIGLVAMVLAPRLLAESRGAPRAADVPGLVLLAAGLAALVWGIIREDATAWTAASIVGGVVLLGAFAVRQARASSPLLPRHLFTDRTFASATGTVFLMGASLMGAAFLVPQYLQTGLRYSALEGGARMLPWTIMPMLLAPVVGRLGDRIGNRPLMVAGLVLQGSAFLWLAAVAGPATAYGTLFAPLLVAGIGIALVFPAVSNAVVGAVAPADLGLASAANATARQVGGLVGVAVATAVFGRAGGFESGRAIVDGLAAALVVVAAISLAGAAASLGVRRPVVADQAGREQEADVLKPV